MESKQTGSLPKRLLLKKQKLEELENLQKKIDLKEGLPHRHKHKQYKWSKEFWEDTNKEAFIVAANQIGKSSIHICRFIEWAGNKELWPKLWPGMEPNQFWYLYPNQDTVNAEFETKWKQYLPAGKYKDHEWWGWKLLKEKQDIVGIKFNSGVIIYFKTYSQNVQNLQAGTIYAIGCDEELPIELRPELVNRLNATDGYFSMVFTATLGQEYWRKTMEPKESEEELHPDAFKINVSMYDCLEYADGSKSHWTREKIEKAKARCGTQAEILRRIYGRFVVSGGLLYEAFDYDRNTCEPHIIPSTWSVYTGVDIGSGGEKGHPAAITFIAVSPDYRMARVFRGWRGDGIPTTCSDILTKYRELRGPLKPVLQQYDWQAKDFFEIASRIGETFVPANKNREVGKNLLNVLFKHGMLKIFRGDPELEKLSNEFMALLEGTAKTKAKDDFVDSCRYAAAMIPFDMTVIEEAIVLVDGEIKEATVHEETEMEREIRERRAAFDAPQVDEMTEELDFWNGLLES